MTKPLTLVLLAAGLGRRFGGDKQFATVSDCGATLLDYTLYDARRAGFGRAVCVIRPGAEALVAETIGARWGDAFEIVCAPQRIDDLPGGFTPPAGRTKPWGTGQAVLAAADTVPGRFVVVNADDFYGAGAFAALAQFLAEQDVAAAEYALVSYPLRATLSQRGTVNRARCAIGADRLLTRVEELIDLAADGDDAVRTVDGRTERIAGDTEVSMNVWGFTPAVFAQLRSAFVDFLHGAADSTSAEFYLPSGIQQQIDAGAARVHVLAGDGRWCGLTHPDDLSRVRAFVSEQIEHGVYPEVPWQ